MHAVRCTAGGRGGAEVSEVCCELLVQLLSLWCLLVFFQSDDRLLAPLTDSWLLGSFGHFLRAV